MSERSIFLSASEIADPGERAAYLDRACAGEPALRGRVEALLSAADRTGSFMDRPAPDLLPPTVEAARAVDPGPAGGGGVTATRLAEPLTVRPLAAETLPALLRRRLRLAFLIVTGFFVGAGCLGIVNLVLHDWVLPQRLRNGAIFFSGVTAVLVALTVLLWSRRPFSLARLRVTELTLVAFFALGCVWKQVTSLNAAPALVRLYGDTGVMMLAGYHALFWFALLATYGLFVPNSWRRCAAVVVGIAACPLAVALVQAARPNAELAGRPLLYYLTGFWSVR
jgi:hypothetical protein